MESRLLNQLYKSKYNGLNNVKPTLVTEKNNSSRGYVLLLEHEHLDWFHLNVTGSEYFFANVRIPHNLYLW